MNISFTKKFIGTAVFGLAILGASFSTYSVASAMLIQRGTRVEATGTVISVDVPNQQFMFAGTGTDPVMISVTDSTQYYGIDSLSDLAAGDLILLRDTKTGDVNVATKIKEISENQAYGHTQVRVQSGTVSSKTDTTLTVMIGVTNVTFYIAPETDFMNKSFADLAAGDRVMVAATDNGTTYLAQTVSFIQ